MGSVPPFLSKRSFLRLPAIPSLPFRPNMITPEQFEVILENLSRDEVCELSSMIDRMDNKSNEAVLEAYYEFKRTEVARAVVKMFENDPLHKAMKEGLLWGDLDAPKPRVEEVQMPEEDHDWIMPRMVLRKDIYTNFPVVVRKINTREREVYAVEWHHDNFVAQRNASDSWCEYDDFEETVERRLTKALYSSRNWTVEAGHGNELCRIVMAVEENLPLPAPKATPAPKPAVDADGWQEVSKGGKAVAPYTGPRLVRLNDIKVHFPVVWRQVEGVKTTTYSLELMNKTIRQNNLNANTVKTSLLEALRHSKFWKVLPATNNTEVCRLEMNHI